jgi:hypothetical protein
MDGVDPKNVKALLDACTAVEKRIDPSIPVFTVAAIRTILLTDPNIEHVPWDDMNRQQICRGCGHYWPCPLSGEGPQQPPAPHPVPEKGEVGPPPPSTDGDVVEATPIVLSADSGA